ncbi:tetratricopeptide repeat protein, partial [Propionibacterium sp. oral taxon 192]|uniref:tetratricopeptide repeat protein n=1 Tax=Propionibacterium sp. oral taxon 192 TaxID=671222 RepID=UPI0018DE98E4
MGALAPFVAKLGMPWPVLGSLAGSILCPTLIKELRDWTSKKSQDQRVAEPSGIHDSLVGKDLEALRVHTSDHDVSEFLPRDAQKELIQAIENHTPTLLVGPSMSGKTRLMVETVRKNYPSTPVWFPKEINDIQRLIDADRGPKRGWIVILDDVDRFLSNQTLSLGQLEAWIQDSCIVIATMMQSSYRPWRDGAKDKLPGWDVVNRFTIIRVASLLTENEQIALRNSSYADLAATVRNVGLAPLLGGAPAVRQRLAEGLERHLWGYALVRAAADWRRVGLGPATKAQLQKVALAFKDDIAWDEPNWKKAWKWASKEVNDTVSLIRQTGSDKWEVLDLVADEADWPLNQKTLEAMASAEHTPHQALAISFAMYTHGALDHDNPVAKRTLQEADIFLQKFTNKATPDSNLFGFYAFFLAHIFPDHDRAEDMFERAIEADPTNAENLGNYAVFLADTQGNHDRAQEMYERAIKADPTDAKNLGNYATFLT